jgi:hypothetical protein
MKRNWLNTGVEQVFEIKIYLSQPYRARKT